MYSKNKRGRNWYSTVINIFIVLNTTENKIEQHFSCSALFYVKSAKLCPEAKRCKKESISGCHSHTNLLPTCIHNLRLAPLTGVTCPVLHLLLVYILFVFLHKLCKKGPNVRFIWKEHPFFRKKLNPFRPLTKLSLDADAPPVYL